MLGMVPVLIAFLGFFFLWLILNYNTFVNILKEIARIQDNIVDLSQKKNDIILRIIHFLRINAPVSDERIYDTISNLGTKINFADDDKQKLILENQLNATYKQLLGIFERNEILNNHPELIQIQKELSPIEAELQENKKRYGAKIDSYNKMTKVMPSKVIASVFRFKEI